MIPGEHFYVLGIDPGNNTGIAIFKLSTLDMSILSIDTLTVVLNNMITGDDIQLERNICLSRVCSYLYSLYKPNLIGVEAAFLNSRFPKAVMQLSQYTSTIDQTFYNLNPFIKIMRFPPKYVKKYIGGGGNADKDRMLVAIKDIPELLSNIDLYRLTEHEVDALAIGYISILAIRDAPHLLMCF